MLLREAGFSFGGVHSRNDMGLIYAEKDGHPAIPAIKRNAYAIAGMDGTVLFPGETRQEMTFEGTLYPAAEPATQAEAQALIRRVAAWLTDGRQRLIFDYEPGVYYLAELSGAGKWSLKNWFGGELPVKFTAQPWAYAVSDTWQTVPVPGDASTTIGYELDTGGNAPLNFEIRNTSSSTITAVDIDGVISFYGIELAPGDTLYINTEPPVSAMMNAVNMLPYARSFGALYAGDGLTEISVGVTGGGADVVIKARGRW